MADLLAAADGLLSLVLEALAADPLADDRLASAADFFARIARLKLQHAGSLARAGGKQSIEQIEAHGRYLAEKHGLDYAAFIEGEPAARGDAFEADALVNSCSNFVALLEQWADRLDLGAGVAWEGMFPPWATEQLEALAELDPRLGLDLDDKAQEFRLTRLRPDRDHLLRTLEEYDSVLGRPPSAVLALEAGAVSAIYVSGAVEAAQTRWGAENVLVIVTGREGADPHAKFRPETRLFIVAQHAVRLSGEQVTRFIRAYLASVQPLAIVNCGSGLIWDLFLDAGKAMGCFARLSAILAPLDFDQKGAPKGVSVTRVPEVLPFLTALWVHDRAQKETLERLFAFPPAWAAKIQVLSVPGLEREFDAA